MKTKNRIRELLKNADNLTLQHPSMDDVSSEFLSEEDIVHYLKTETDRRRLAFWCKQYLNLDY